MELDLFAGTMCLTLKPVTDQFSITSDYSVEQFPATKSVQVTMFTEPFRQHIFYV